MTRTGREYEILGIGGSWFGWTQDGFALAARLVRPRQRGHTFLEIAGSRQGTAGAARPDVRSTRRCSPVTTRTRTCPRPSGRRRWADASEPDAARTPRCSSTGSWSRRATGRRTPSSTRPPAPRSAGRPTPRPPTSTRRSPPPGERSTRPTGRRTSSSGCAACASSTRRCSTHADDFRALTTAEVGMPAFMTDRGRLRRARRGAGWVADLAESYEFESDLGVAEPMGIRSRRTVRREPVGVVAAITPWNVPTQINLAKVGPALAAGCTVVLKPAPDTPWLACELGRLAAEHTDLPPGVLNVVTPRSNEVAAQLTTDPRVDMVSFTGSTATGRAIMAAAAPTLKKVFLELGGKSAAIALDDADVAAVAGATAFAACIHAGQGCAITTRLVVPRERYDEAVQVAATTMESIGAKDPADPGAICGPVISRAQRDRVEAYLRLAVEEGGTLRHGRPRRSSRTASGSSRPSSPASTTRAAAGAGGDLRAGARGDRPRRRRRCGADRQRVRLRPLRLGRLRLDLERAMAVAAPDPHRHAGRQRRGVVQPGRAVRRLQAVRHRPRDGRGRLRGVPGDQD